MINISTKEFDFDTANLYYKKVVYLLTETSLTQLNTAMLNHGYCYVRL